MQDARGVACRLDSQANVGAARTLNRLIEESDADLVAILNSDDRYLRGRLHRMAAYSAGSADFIAFSGVAFDPAAMVSERESFEDWYRGKLAFAMAMPSCGFALVTANLAISSSNFLFSRRLFERIGGFNPSLPLTHDWEFLLKALRWTEPLLVPDRLLYYRTHASNSFRKLVDVRIDQSKRALAAYVAWAGLEAANPLAPSPSGWPRFFQIFARSCAPAFSPEPVGAFLPASFLEGGEETGRCAAVESEAIRNLVTNSRGRAVNLRRSTDEMLNAAATSWEGLRGEAGRRGGDRGAGRVVGDYEWLGVRLRLSLPDRIWFARLRRPLRHAGAQRSRVR